VNGSENKMPQAKYAFALLALTATGIGAQDAASSSRQYHQAPDRDGVYYVGPEVTAPRMVRTVMVPYPDAVSTKDIQGMTVLAMVIDANGTPEHIQVLHKHGDAFDQAAIAAVKQSKFEPGRLGDKPVPVWIDVRIVFRSNRSQAVPQVLITERDLPPPDESQLQDKHYKPLSYTPPFPIHTVDADFADPFAAHPYVQVAIVAVLVSEEGLPKEVRIVRGLGFGLDAKAEAAVWHYRFLPATKKGQPIAARRNVMVDFAKF
jgi:TonB family protein